MELPAFDVLQGESEEKGGHFGNILLVQVFVRHELLLAYPVCVGGELVGQKVIIPCLLLFFRFGVLSRFLLFFLRRLTFFRFCFSRILGVLLVRSRTLADCCSSLVTAFWFV